MALHNWQLFFALPKHFTLYEFFLSPKLPRKSRLHVCLSRVLSHPWSYTVYTFIYIYKPVYRFTGINLGMSVFRTVFFYEMPGNSFFLQRLKPNGTYFLKQILVNFCQHFLQHPARLSLHCMKKKPTNINYCIARWRPPTLTIHTELSKFLAKILIFFLQKNHVLK